MMISESEFFANMCVDAVTRVKTVNAKGEAKYPIKSINILKAHGKSAKETVFIDGYALNCTIAAQGSHFDSRFLFIRNAKTY
jgi:T-complex protein 1 subunit alpha